MSNLHLYGLWRVEFAYPDGVAGNSSGNGNGEVAAPNPAPSPSPTPASALLARATLLFEKNPEYPESVSGAISRDGAKSFVVGDVDDGAFNLEESADGTAISATWTGRVVDGSCAKGIQGLWKSALDGTELRFMLTKASGWN